MMRGMFAAISGLKNHQVMLDVTANDIANVNTIGYKSARTTFKDSLNQLQRGASGPGGGAGGANAAQVGLGVDARLDRQPDAGRRAAVDGQRARRRDHRPRASSGSSTSTATPPTPGATRRVHARRQLHHQRGRLPAHAGRLLRRRARTPAAPRSCSRSRPARPTSRSARTARSPTSTARARASRRASSRWRRSRTRPASSARLQPLAAVGQLGRRRRSASPARSSASPPPARRDVQRGPRPDVHAA